MVELPGGTFRMGSDRFYPEERPVREVSVGSFSIDRHPVTVAEFRRFVKATGHVTWPSRRPSPTRIRTPTRSCSFPGPLFSAKPTARSTSATFATGGTGCPVPTGVIPRTRQHGRWSRAASCDARRLRGRRGLCGLGREVPPQRSRMGVRRPRRARGRDLHLGRGVRTEGTDDGEHLAGRVPLAEPPHRRLRRNLARRALPVERLRALRHGGQRLGMDERHVRTVAARQRPAVLRAAEPARRARSVSAEGDQGRLPSLRPELLPPLPACGTSGRNGRHLDRPHRLPLRRPGPNRRARR